MDNLRSSLNNVSEGEQLTDQMGFARATCPPESAPDFSASEAKLSQAIKDEPAVRKVVRRSARLADLITDDDRVRAKEVIRDAMEATTRIYDGKAKALDIQPDHKTRLAAATLQLAYDEGTPVKRSVSISADFRSADEIVKAIQASPEASRALAALSGLGIRLEAEGEIINIIPENVKTGQNGTEEPES